MPCACNIHFNIFFYFVILIQSGTPYIFHVMYETHYDNVYLSKIVLETERISTRERERERESIVRISTRYIERREKL